MFELLVAAAWVAQRRSTGRFGTHSEKYDEDE
jgi:hypothetical protein